MKRDTTYFSQFPVKDKMKDPRDEQIDARLAELEREFKLKYGNPELVLMFWILAFFGFCGFLLWMFA